MSVVTKFCETCDPGHDPDCPANIPILGKRKARLLAEIAEIDGEVAQLQGEASVGKPSYYLAAENPTFPPEKTAFVRFVEFPEGSGLPCCPVCGKRGEEPPEDCNACEDCHCCPAECDCDPEITTCGRCGGSGFWTMTVPFTAGRMEMMVVQMSEPLEPLTPVCSDHPTAPVEAVYRELLRSIDYLLYLCGRDKDARQRALEILVDGEPRGRILTLEDEAEDEAT